MRKVSALFLFAFGLSGCTLTAASQFGQQIPAFLETPEHIAIETLLLRLSDLQRLKAALDGQPMPPLPLPAPSPPPPITPPPIVTPPSPPKGGPPATLPLAPRRIPKHVAGGWPEWWPEWADDRAP